jgi:hypothetical protein
MNLVKDSTSVSGEGHAIQLYFKINSFQEA